MDKIIQEVQQSDRRQLRSKEKEKQQKEQLEQHKFSEQNQLEREGQSQEELQIIDDKQLKVCLGPEWLRWKQALKNYTPFPRSPHLNYLKRKPRTLHRKIPQTFINAETKAQPIVNQSLEKKKNSQKHLSSEQINQIEQIFRTGTSTAEQIKKIFGISKKGVYKYLRQFEDGGKDKANPNHSKMKERRWTTTASQRKLIELTIGQILKKDSTLTHTEIRQELSEKYNIHLCQSTASRRISNYKMNQSNKQPI